jgi:hypothetical protein
LDAKLSELQAVLNESGRKLGACEKIGQSVTPKQTSGHSIAISVLNAKGESVSGISAEIWSEKKGYPDFERGKSICKTNASGSCVIDDLKVELPDVWVGVGNSDCAVSYGRLPADPQDIQITLRFTN